VLNGNNTDRARDALHTIPPDLPRQEWLKAGMAAHAAGLSFDDFDQWSAPAGNYNAQACRATWRSFKTAPGGVTAGTLFGMARDHGWSEDDKPQQRTKPLPRPSEAPAKPRPGMGAAEIFARSEPATNSHPYIVKKGAAGVPLGGLRVVPDDDPLTIKGQRMAGALVVPAYAPSGEIQSLQFIPHDGGDKLNLPAAKIAGTSFTVGTEGPVYVCEGIGAAWACYQATGHRAVCCFGCAHVGTIAAQLRQREPDAKLVICPDTGQEAKAAKIAAEVSGLVTAMPYGWQKNSDVNDLAQRDGMDVLQALLENAVEPPRPLKDGVVLVNGADLTPEPISWLWREWLALGKMHILAGAPGQGKTTIAIGFAATVTSGGRWPDGSRCPVGNVLIWSGEDSPADTLLPRLIAAGGDRKRVFFVDGTRVNGQVQSFDPARDMLALQAQAERIGDIRLIIVDPVVSAVMGDSHKNTEVRRALQPLVDLAANMNTALLGITHFSKGGQGIDPAQRVLGSVAFTAVARVVLVAAKVKAGDGEDRRILARGKSNIGPDDGGYEYHLDQTEALPGIPACRVAWGAAVQGSARELLTDPSEQDDGKTAVDSATDFLREVLKDGSTPCKTVQAEGKEAGISWASIRRAADSLMVIKTKGVGGWYWKLATRHQGVQDAQHAQL
jgi:putative DNA primase/helicase